MIADKSITNIFVAPFLVFITVLFVWPHVAKAQDVTKDFQIVAEDAAWCWFSDPRAVYHNGQREAIYYGYINSQGDVVISARDMPTQDIETFVLHEKLQVDDHNVPSILVLPDGHLLVFYTEHNGRFFTRKSKKPEDINAWHDVQIIPFGGTRITYSHPVMLAGEQNRIYVFWRGSDWQQTFAYSDDLGTTWSEPEVLIASEGARNRPYLKVTTDGMNRIDFVFTDGHPGVEPTNSVYHTYYEKGVFYQTNGSEIATMEQLPLSRSVVDKVYDAVHHNVRSWISDVALDKQGNPVIAYTRYPTDDDHRYHYAVWQGNSWQDEEICKAGGWMPRVVANEEIREPHYSGGMVIDHSDASNVYLSREVDGTFEIEHWEKINSKWQTTPLTVHSAKDNMRPYALKRPVDRSPIVLWMTGHYSHYTKFDTMILINAEVEKVN